MAAHTLPLRVRADHALNAEMASAMRHILKIDVTAPKTVTESLNFSFIK